MVAKVIFAIFFIAKFEVAHEALELSLRLPVVFEAINIRVVAVLFVVVGIVVVVVE